jgi:hypothetical protein
VYGGAPPDAVHVAEYAALAANVPLAAAGQLGAGKEGSDTVIVKVAELDLPELSVTVTVTTYDPGAVG